MSTLNKMLLLLAIITPCIPKIQLAEGITVYPYELLAILSSPILIKYIKFDVQKISGLSKWTNKKPLEVIKLSELEKVKEIPSDVLERAREMATLQPEKLGEKVLTKQQLFDAYNKAEINNLAKPKTVYVEQEQFDSILPCFIFITLRITKAPAVRI